MYGRRALRPMDRHYPSRNNNLLFARIVRLSFVPSIGHVCPGHAVQSGWVMTNIREPVDCVFISLGWLGGDVGNAAPGHAPSGRKHSCSPALFAHSSRKFIFHRFILKHTVDGILAYMSPTVNISTIGDGHSGPLKSIGTNDCCYEY